MPMDWVMRAKVESIPTLTENSLVSVSMVTSTGTGTPLYSAVSSLILLTIAMMLTPRGPRAGPMGGPPDASPPLTMKLKVLSTI